MESKEEYKRTLTEIRDLMDTSSRFHSLSGLAGISAGFIALVGTAVFYLHFGFSLLDPFLFINYQTVPFLLFDGLIILSLSLFAAFFFTKRNAAKNDEKLWTPVFKRVLLYWLIPMVPGGIILLSFAFGQGPILFPSAIALSIIFYGIALVNASKYSMNELFWLGISELIIGLAAFFFWKYSLLLWAAGFGLMNILIGCIAYYKYESRKS